MGNGEMAEMAEMGGNGGSCSMEKVNKMDTTTTHHTTKEIKMEFFVPTFFASHVKKYAPTIPAKFITKANALTKYN
jgi:hypothetical protein